MFWIGFTEEVLPKVEPQEEGRVGLLMLGKHEERFVAHFWTWSEQQYLNHWEGALARALKGKSSALVTDMRTPTQSSHLVWWPFWRINGELVFHNQLLFFEQHKIQGPHIEIDYLCQFVGEREPYNDNGIPISEWIVPVSDVEEFLALRDGHR